MDYKLYYPSRSDIRNHEEKDFPHLYNYVCIKGKQIFLHKNYQGFYMITTCDFSPLSFPRNIEKKKTFSLYDNYFYSQDYECALSHFYLASQELIRNNSHVLPVEKQLELF